MKLRSLLASLLCAALSVPGYAAVTLGAGARGSSFLSLVTSAAAAGMGEANTAWADDAYGMYFNPAGIAQTRHFQVGTMYNQLFGDIGYSYAGVTGLKLLGGTFGASVSYLDLGTVKRTTVTSGQNRQYVGTASASDLVFGITYARTAREFLDLGATIKVIEENLDRYSASAVALDLGATWRIPMPGLTLGLSLSNLGSSLKFVSVAEPLPLTMRIGLGYRRPGAKWSLAGDVVKVEKQDPQFKIGGQVWVWRDRVALRAGIKTNDASHGASVGAAFRLSDLSLDYAFAPYGDLGNSHLVSLGYEFGRSRSAPRPQSQPVSKVAIPAGESVVSSAAPAPIRPVSVPTTPATAPMTPAVTPTTPVPATKPPPPAPVTQTVVAPVTNPWTSSSSLAVLPFRCQAGTREDLWIGTAFSDFTRRKWDRSGLVAKEAQNPTIIFEGDYTVVNEVLTMTAKISRDQNSLKTFLASGSMDNMLLVFDELLGDVNVELRKLGVPLTDASFPSTHIR